MSSLVTLTFPNMMEAGFHKPQLLWDIIVDYIIHTPIRFADGERHVKHSGVASGSYFTQLIDSIVNYIV